MSSPLTEHRPWGYYQVLADELDHKIKRLCVYPDRRLSLQSHQKRSEHWYVLQGEACVTLNQEEIMLRPGQAVDIPIGTKHRLQNRGTENLLIIEIQTGKYFGEDDIERFNDDYGRI